jgi:hypothetical protein
MSEKKIKVTIPAKKKEFYKKCKFNKNEFEAIKAFYLWKKKYN